MISMTAQPLKDLEYPLIHDRAREVESRRGRPPKLVVVMVGSHAPSEIYVNTKKKTAESLGIQSEIHRFPESVSEAELEAEVIKLNQDPTVDGILIQRPLPSQIREEKALFWVHPSKDVDGLHPENLGRAALGLSGLKPCTPWGVLQLLKHYRVPLEGHVACIVGRSNIVGKPMHALLLQENMTVIQAHSRTRDLRSFTQQADLVIMAVGKPNLLRGNMLKKGAVVVDVGINRLIDGKIVGDVDQASVSPLVSALTPVPGGVGPMTILSLMKNTVTAAESTLNAGRPG